MPYNEGIQTREEKAMYDMDKEKFGAFVAQLRKDRGMTQKELADQLFVSNKAVSKWETGVSIPDVGLLIPLAEALGVTVTELLSGERQSQSMNTAQVETVVKKAIAYSDELPRRKLRGKNLLLYLCCILVTMLELAVLHLLGYSSRINREYLILTVSFGLLFGAYFLLFAKDRLPDYYDSNRINGMIDGPFRMNIPSIRFSNRNWPYIVRCGQIWAMVTMTVYPILTVAMTAIFSPFWQSHEEKILLVLLLGCLFLPMVIVGKKYE